MIAIPQSVTSRIVLKAYLSSDHVSSATGKTIAVVISKNGAAFANPSAGATNATEIGSGWYYVDLSTTDTATQGPVIIRGTSSGVDDVETYRQVVDAHNAGFDGVPSATAAASGGLPVLGTNATAISFTGGMTISSTTGNALALTSSGGNGDGLAVTGNGSGHGIHLVPGATGNGLLAIGGATSGTAIKATGTAGNAIALELAGQGSAAGISATGGATGIGITAVGGATSGSGLKVAGTAGNAIALEIAGQGSAAGIQATGGATGSAFKLVGGATSGHGLAVTTTSGDGFNLTPTAGNAITATANGTSKHGIVATGGTAGTSDGASFVAGTGGVDFRANQTGNFTGNLSGSVGSVSGAVGSVTGAVGSVTGNVGGNVTGSVGSVTAAVSLSTSDSPVVQSGTAQAGGALTITLSGSAAATDNLYNGQTVKTIAGTGPAQVRVITGYVGSTKVATVDRAWATNPDVTTTYAVLATDHPKINSSLEIVSASVTGAVGSVTGAVGSVTGSVGSVSGNVGGNVVGSVASVTARVTANADQWAGTTIPAPTVTGVPKVDIVDIAGAAVSTSTAQLGVNAVQIGALVPGSATIGTVTNLTTNNDKTGYALTLAYDPAKTAAQAGDAMTLTGAYDAARTALPASAYTAPDNTSITAIKAKTDNLPASPAATADIPTASANASATWDSLRASHTTSGTFGQGAASVQGNVTGSVASVAAAVTVGTNNDKAGYALGNPGPNPIGTVVADGSNSPTSFVTDRTETVDGYWDDALLLLTSGVLAGQVKKVSGYIGATKTVTVGAFTSTPAAGVTFQLINR